MGKRYHADRDGGDYLTTEPPPINEHMRGSSLAVSGLLSCSSFVLSAGSSISSSLADVNMLHHIVAVCTVGYITLLYSQSAWTFPRHKTACNHQSDCRLVPGVDHGSSEIKVLPNGLAFITSGFDIRIPGNILLFDFKKPTLGVHALDIVGDLDRPTFSPLGLSIWRDYNSKVIYIFVANAPEGRKHTVEKFRFDEKRRKLYKLRTYLDRTFIQLCGIVAMGEDSFYFTNYIEFGFVTEFLYRLSLGNVGFYDGTRGHVLLAGRSIPIGINTSPDDKYVYMTELGGKRISIYIRESDNTLTLIQVVPLPTFADNVGVDVVTGHLWVAVHPDAQLLVNHMPWPHTALAPSQVLRLTLSEDSKVTDITEVYCNDGRQISAATVAVQYRRYMLVGSLFTKLLLCEVNHD
ncbi:Serum paraoxonase/arylesterase 1 [Lamellibrachia satsuma]|nr:Serum paraoxonase/arylesterase 1 [Lamellibrachia satsuma]